MRRWWKKAAELADNTNHSLEEVGEAILAAAAEGWRKDMSGALARSVAVILGDNDQRMLSIDRIGELAQIRHQCQTPLEALLVDSAVDALRCNVPESELLSHAVSDALLESVLRDLRSIEEHYLRGSWSRRALDVRARLEGAFSQARFSELAHALAGGLPRGIALRPIKHDGVDEGVPLC
jgi:hypothetical protein